MKNSDISRRELLKVAVFGTIGSTTKMPSCVVAGNALGRARTQEVTLHINVRRTNDALIEVVREAKKAPVLVNQEASRD